MSNEGGAPPADEKGADNTINVRVVNSDGNEIYFRIKRTTPFRRLFSTYHTKVGSPAGSFRFFFDGRRLEEDQTPAELEMNDQDLIDALVTQTGGCQ